ncbi:MAG: hypothetical protein ABS46_11535 [Cytophagaceae bacterium SCN 52-12]|nr:MAG: hypothetical protein ABS46_11535 [Cytophagaceae bacterium SCN 52-12]
MKPTISRDFIFEYFSGRATSIQKQLIDKWVKDPSNEDAFYRYLEEWERLHPQYVVDVPEGIRNFRKLLKETAPAAGEEIPQAAPARRRSIKAWILAASVTLLLVSAAWFGRESILYTAYRTNPGEVKPYELPDGSVVTLNANSRLTVSRFWTITGNREVFLSGEAEFKVRRTEEGRKFTVRTNNDVEIVVLGTIFTVFNRHKRTAVTLNEGKVQLTHQVGNTIKTIEMAPGDKIMVEANRPAVVESGKDPAKTTLWKEKRFEFDQTSLENISGIMNDYYNLTAAFADTDVRSQTITGSFVAANADEFLESICLLNGLRYQKSGQIVTFYKENH